ncbi:MAG: hypothetical protein K2K97_09485, partial [Muribaculaceae bacterium]|nr:hypothetical protein [Muribaculaceae bacterium]
GCDRKGAELDRTFDRADALMTDHPDSALAIMQAVDTAGLSRPRLARYALLLTKAEQKNNTFRDSDFLIKIALDYYCGKDSKEEIASLYYYGNVLFSMDSINLALPILNTAYEQARDKEEWFYAGMSARIISDIYDHHLLFPSQIKYVYLAKEAYRRYEDENRIEDHKYSIWMDTSIAEYYVNTGQYERCIEFCDSIRSSHTYQTDSYRHFIWINEAHAYCYAGNPQRSIQIYDSLMNSGYDMEGFNWNRLSEYYFRNEEYEKSLNALDSAKAHTHYNQDPLYIAYLENLHSSKSNDPQESLKTLHNLNRQIIETSNIHASKSPLPEVVNTYNIEAKRRKDKLAIQKLMIISLVAGVIIIIVLSALKFERFISKLKTKRQELAELTDYQQTLENEIALLNDGKKLLLQQKDDLMKRNSDLSQVNNGLTVENTHLKVQVGAATERGAGLEMQIGELVEEISAYSKIIDEHGKNTSEIRRKSNKNDKEHLKHINKF